MAGLGGRKNNGAAPLAMIFISNGGGKDGKGKKKGQKPATQDNKNDGK